MEVILEFVRNHYMDLIKLGFLIVTLLILIFKKKVKSVDVIKTVILEVLPKAISDAEIKFPGPERGSEKFEYVLDLVQEYITVNYGLSRVIVYELYNSFIKESIEDILSTPTKKER